MENLTFNEFCIKYCDGIYTKGLPDDAQCTGYKQLKKMVKENINPVASMAEIAIWERYVGNLLQPDEEYLYLTFLHPVLKPYIIENWQAIKKMKIDN